MRPGPGGQTEASRAGPRAPAGLRPTQRWPTGARAGRGCLEESAPRGPGVPLPAERPLSPPGWRVAARLASPSLAGDVRPRQVSVRLRFTDSFLGLLVGDAIGHVVDVGALAPSVEFTLGYEGGGRRKSSPCTAAGRWPQFGRSGAGLAVLADGQGAGHLVAQVQSLKLFFFAPGSEGVASITLLLSSWISSMARNRRVALL